ncbi:hypothetical protein D3C71_1892760 [compost metagenome]
MPLAPPLFSTTTGWPVSWVKAWPSARAIWSVALPAANGTTKVNAFDGYFAAVWAKAAGAAASTSAATRLAPKVRRRRD